MQNPKCVGDSRDSKNDSNFGSRREMQAPGICLDPSTTDWMKVAEPQR